jgi:hypothetical protein
VLKHIIYSFNQQHDFSLYYWTGFGVVVSITLFCCDPDPASTYRVNSIAFTYLANGVGYPTGDHFIPVCLLLRSNRLSIIGSIARIRQSFVLTVVDTQFTACIHTSTLTHAF